MRLYLSSLGRAVGNCAWSGRMTADVPLIMLVIGDLEVPLLGMPIIVNVVCDAVRGYGPDAVP